MVEGLKIQVLKKEPMSRQGIRHWHPKRRKNIHRYVYIPKHGSYAKIEEFDTEKKIAKFIWDNYGSGEFYVMGRSKGSNRFSNKPVKLCFLQIRDLGDERYSYEISQTWRLRQRYKWFYKGH